MSATSYIRVQTPEATDTAHETDFRHTFAHEFKTAGGKRGASIVKINHDAFTGKQTPLLCVMIKGHMTPKQTALVAGLR